MAPGPTASRTGALFLPGRPDDAHVVSGSRSPTWDRLLRPSLAMRRARWFFTVCSRMPSLRAMALFPRPFRQQRHDFQLARRDGRVDPP